jgi:glycerol-3-phosphate O-acyltransferase
MDEVINAVLSYPKMKAFLDENPDKIKEVLSCIKEIRGNFNPKLVRGAIKLIDATFAKLYDGVNLEVPKGFDLVDLAKDHHVILVPNHQSHADYVALTYTLFGVYDIPIYIAGGINLNIFPLGAFFRQAGAFFIRRKFNDDIVYKTAFEAYIFSLLYTNKVVEFFFEGGRSRTGKLLKPRYGLFTMLLEAHSELKTDKPLVFLPVALAHEHIPEEQAHAKELGGAKKKVESASQLFKVFSIFKKKLGTIHVRISDPIYVGEYTDLKTKTQQVAFECFNKIGKAMPVTPSSLLSLIMLDEPTGTISWVSIEKRAEEIIAYCRRFNIPITPSLYEDEVSYSLRKALDLYVLNKKIKVIKRRKLDEVFYAVKEESRVGMLYAKNMILHHFIVPCFINGVWLNIFRGEIKTGKELTRFLLQKRKELKYEFYLPTIKEMINQALGIVEYGIGRKLDSLEDALALSSPELYKIASKVKRFSTAFAHIYEAYYVAASAIKYIGEKEFDLDKYTSVAKELFEMEIEHGQILKYRESYTVPKMKDALNYFINQKAVEVISGDVAKGGKFKIVDTKKMDRFMEKFTGDLGDQISISLKLEHESKSLNDE